MNSQARGPATRLRALRRLALVSALFSLGACATAGSGPVEELHYVCADPRPEVCTMDYNPVCATLVDGSRSTYPNGCGACADAAVVSHFPGACE